MCELGSKHLKDKAKAKDKRQATSDKRYDEAFKREAVEPWLVSGKSARQIASELGLNEQSRKGWKQKFKQRPAGQVAPHAGRAPGREPPPPARAAPGAGTAGHSKKNLGHHLRTERERFVRIEAMQEEHASAGLCAARAVSRSGNHAWAAREPGPRAQSQRRALAAHRTS